MGFHEMFHQARSQILLINLIPLANQANSMLLQDESQRSISIHTSKPLSYENAALAAQGTFAKGSKKKSKLAEAR